MAENKYSIYCSVNDYYIGDTIHREISKTGKEADFYYNSIPDNLGDAINFIGVINPQVLAKEEFVSLISEISSYDCNKTYLLENEKIDNYPPTWGEIRYIDAKKGLDKAIIKTLEDDSKHPVGVLRNIKLEVEITRKLEEERKEKERLEALEKEKQAQLKAEKDAEEARKIYMRVAQPSLVEDLVILQDGCSPNVKKGIKYLIGDGLPKDGLRAFSILKKEVKEHPEDPMAQYHLGVCYNLGYSGLPQNEASQEMQKIFRNLLQYGIVNVYVLLGFSLVSTTENTTESEKIFHQLAELNKALSDYFLGYLYEQKGKYEEALEKYYDAAEDGLATAQNALGYMYAEGWGVEIDISKAQQWFEVAAAQGLNEAKVNLGVVYLNSNNQEQVEEGINLIQQVAETGNPEAMGIMEEIERLKRKQRREEEKRIRQEQTKEELKNIFSNLISSTGRQIKASLDRFSEEGRMM